MDSSKSYLENTNNGSESGCDYGRSPKMGSSRGTRKRPEISVNTRDIKITA